MERVDFEEVYSSKIVKWYKKDITFLVDKYNFFIEVVIARTSWVDKLPYELSEEECMDIIEILFKMPKDVNVEIFGTFEEIVGKFGGRRSSKTTLVPKGKKMKRSVDEVFGSSSKISKGKIIAKRYKETVIVESDDEDLEKANVQKSVLVKELVIASLEGIFKTQSS